MRISGRFVDISAVVRNNTLKKQAAQVKRCTAGISIEVFTNEEE
jgi:hypothetical protein